MRPVLVARAGAGRMRRLLAAGAALLACTGAAVARAQAAASPSPARARLTGVFQMSGTITTAYNVRGERTGQKVKRTWSFLPECSAGVCKKVLLVRHRAGGTDKIVLRNDSSAHYIGTGSFYAPLKCDTHTWHRGAWVPFTIRVRITRAAVSNGAVVATTIDAFYKNTFRVNKTPCVVATLGHDAAFYTGTPAPPSSSGSSGLSPAGS